MNKADFFISHASEDKETFVRDLANNLLINGALVFYDEYSIKLGDSLSDSINKGIAVADHAIIILSKYFFEKSWTNAELQALFNKSVGKGFKLLIIYHGVEHREVAEKYPLLADIKGIDSSEGVEKITGQLFNAIGKKGQLSYLTHDYQRKPEELEEGFSISMGLGFPNFGNDEFVKILFELGRKNVFHSRLKLIVVHKRIHFEIVDSSYHKISISTDISKWKPDEKHFFNATLNLKEKKIFLFVDDKVVDQINFSELDIDKNFLQNATGILGNSLELRNPCPFLIGHYSTGKSMNEKMVKSLSGILGT